MDRQIQPISHRDVIKAWANGAIIQVYDEATGTWEDCHGNDPAWFATSRYRVKPKLWKPKFCGNYFFVSDEGHIDTAVWENKCSDHSRYRFGNVFSSIQDAQAAADRIKAVLTDEAPTEENETPAKTEPWTPSDNEKIYFVNSHTDVKDCRWERDSAFFKWLFAANNCFKTYEEAETAAERVKAALRGEESEEMKKIREENEELKKEIAKAKTEVRKIALSPYLDGEPVSDGELALIRAIRNASNIGDLYWHEQGRVIGVNHALETVVDLTIGIGFKDGEGWDVFEALDQIKQENS